MRADATAERFWRRVTEGTAPSRRPELGPCWLWPTASYGQFWLRGRNVKAHRFAYELLIGEIPVGLVLDHLCLTPRCVNPYHLDPVPPAVNSERGGAPVEPKRHCPQGHPYDATNTLLYRGWRYCRTCRRERDQERVRQARGRRLAALQTDPRR